MHSRHQGLPKHSEQWILLTQSVDSTAAPVDLIMVYLGLFASTANCGHLASTANISSFTVQEHDRWVEPDTEESEQEEEQRQPVAA